MGKIKSGILGGFSGKVGAVIGSSWRGIAYMRSMPQSVRNPRTLLQRTYRQRFAVAVNFLKTVNTALQIGWKSCAQKKQSAFNAAMSYTIEKAIVGNYPNFSIDPAKALISRGSLPSAFETELGSTGNGVLLKWTDNSGVGSASASDRVLAAVVNHSRGEAVTVTGGVARETGRQTVVTPLTWTDCDVDCYLGFISQEGEVSDSVYMGSITII